jgi:hypothetical protein
MLWSFGNFGIFFPVFGILHQEKSGNPASALKHTGLGYVG